tara:strand:+ start:98 stop:598 length:501 start_codon:yes stop_codon:yes gene_type:complete
MQAVAKPSGLSPRSSSPRSPHDSQEIKATITSCLAKGETVSFEECKRMVTDILDASEAQAKEDLELLESLTEQVARDGAEHLLPVLAEMPPVFNTDTRELIDSILIAGERDVGTRGAENTGVAVDHARRKASQRVVDLVDIVSVCRAERVKLLAELVTASRSNRRR